MRFHAPFILREREGEGEREREREGEREREERRESEREGRERERERERALLYLRERAPRPLLYFITDYIVLFQRKPRDFGFLLSKGRWKYFWRYNIYFRTIWNCLIFIEKYIHSYLEGVDVCYSTYPTCRIPIICYNFNYYYNKLAIFNFTDTFENSWKEVFSFFVPRIFLFVIEIFYFKLCEMIDNYAEQANLHKSLNNCSNN